MPVSSLRIRLLVALVASAPALCLLAVSSGLSPLEREGKKIYREGLSASGEKITAMLGEVEVPAAILPCSNCHGYDGLGRSEAGVIPSNITWEALTKPYGVRHDDGRVHPAYDDRLVKRAFTMGIDPAGNRLNLAMPRYRMTHDQAQALVAYLRVLGVESDPGVSDTAIRLGAILPPEGQGKILAETVRTVLKAYFDRLNGQGAFYNRQVELDFITLPADPAARAEAVRGVLEEGRIFALIAGYLSGSEEELLSVIQELEVPLVGAFTLFRDRTFPPNRYAFYILPGLEEQGRALLQFASDLGKVTGSALVLHARDPRLSGAAQAIVEKVEADPVSVWTRVERLDFQPGTFDARRFVEEKKDTGVAALLFLGSPAETRILIEEAGRQDWKPRMLFSYALSGYDGLADLGELSGRVLIAFSAQPADMTPRMRALYRELAEAHGLTTRLTPFSLRALGAGEVLSEALRTMGRAVSREKLVDTLQRLDGYEIGLTPRISYGPNRRVGALGAYVASFRDGQVTQSLWIELRSTR